MEKLKLFCLPHAGGSAYNYSRWKKYFPSTIEVIPIELSGRGSRIKERCYDNLNEAVLDIYEKVSTQIRESPYILFGHSMGGLIAYELVRKLQDENQPLPKILIISGRNPPNDTNSKKRYELPFEEFKREILRISDLSREVFRNPELLNLYLPILRSDFKIIDTYEFNNNQYICNVDLMVLSGKEDVLTSREKLTHWSLFSDQECTFYSFSGGHFFLHECTQEIAYLIMRKLNIRL
ncbi:thioesterase II family protein [Bacillus cereus]|uniref:thioesterase II family protein n=1 Tax=Bacillus cereus TaxID=1396 RepID=UPI0040397C7D